MRRLLAKVVIVPDKRRKKCVKLFYFFGFGLLKKLSKKN